jgi:hypothetical protein
MLFQLLYTLPKCARTISAIYVKFAHQHVQAILTSNINHQHVMTHFPEDQFPMTYPQNLGIWRLQRSCIVCSQLPQAPIPIYLEIDYRRIYMSLNKLRSSAPHDCPFWGFVSKEYDLLFLSVEWDAFTFELDYTTATSALEGKFVTDSEDYWRLAGVRVSNLQWLFKYSCLRKCEDIAYLVWPAQG